MVRSIDRSVDRLSEIKKLFVFIAFLLTDLIEGNEQNNKKKNWSELELVTLYLCLQEPCHVSRH